MSQSINIYVAPITMGFTPADGDLIRGTVNGVEVSGEWWFNGVQLLDDSKNHICAVAFDGPQSALVVRLPSALTTDYELHLYRYTPEGIVQIPQEYVEGLEETAADAREALENAMEAQSTADAVKGLSYTLEEKNYNGVYDKKTEGRYTFKCNAFDYYKISDFTVTYGEIKQFSGTNAVGTDTSTVYSGKNCVVCGNFIVVNASGKCSYTNEFGTFEFTAPSAGLYALYNGDTNPLTAGSYNFTFNIIAPIVTNPNTYKKYYITVDDSGTLKATEVT